MPQDSKNIVEAILKRTPCRRVALQDIIWKETLDKWLTQGYPTDDTGEPVDPTEHFGFDMDHAGGWFDVMPLRGVEEIVNETDEVVVKRNGAGAVLKFWKNRAGVPEHIDFKMTSRKVWEDEYRPHLLAIDKERVGVEYARSRLDKRRQQGLWCSYGHLFVWENMRQSMGDLCLYESLMLDPDWIHDYCRVYTDFFKMHYSYLLNQAGIPDGIWMYEDLGYKNGLFCSTDILKNLIFPYYHEMVQFFHSYNLPVILHSCGGIEQAMDLIIECGFDALNPMEVKAGCDPVQFAIKYGSRVSLIGGLDVRILESHDRSLIKAEVKKLMCSMKAAGAMYVFSSDHSVSSNVDYDDYRCALDAYRDNMIY